MEDNFPASAVRRRLLHRNGNLVPPCRGHDLSHTDMLDFLFAQLLILLNDKKYLFNCDKVPLTWQENRHQISYWPAFVHRRQLKLTMHFTNYVSPASIFRPNSSHSSMRVKIPHNVCVMSGPAARLLVCTQQTANKKTDSCCTGIVHALNGPHVTQDC